MSDLKVSLPEAQVQEVVSAAVLKLVHLRLEPPGE